MDQTATGCSQMPKLYYYDCFGKAESIRMLLHHAKVQFEDIRVDLNDIKY